MLKVEMVEYLNLQRITCTSGKTTNSADIRVSEIWLKPDLQHSLAKFCLLFFRISLRGFNYYLYGYKSGVHSPRDH